MQDLSRIRLPDPVFLPLFQPQPVLQELPVFALRHGLQARDAAEDPVAVQKLCALCRQFFFLVPLKGSARDAKQGPSLLVAHPCGQRIYRKEPFFLFRTEPSLRISPDVLGEKPDALPKDKQTIFRGNIGSPLHGNVGEHLREFPDQRGRPQGASVLSGQRIGKKEILRRLRHIHIQVKPLSVQRLSGGRRKFDPRLQKQFALIIR